jgi:hypothetical protein
VIVAGYPEEMQGFLASNAGLASRFTRYVNFANYTPGELVEIIGRHAGSSGYELADDTVMALREHFATIERGRTFGNARYARQLLEGMITHQAGRLSRIDAPTMADLRTLRSDDLVGTRS